MKDAIMSVFMVALAAVGFAGLLGAHPTPKSDEGRKPITDLQMDQLRERFPGIVLDTKYRAKVCRNEVYWYFYANHDALASWDHCW